MAVGRLVVQALSRSAGAPRACSTLSTAPCFSTIVVDAGGGWQVAEMAHQVEDVLTLARCMLQGGGLGAGSDPARSRTKHAP